MERVLEHWLVVGISKHDDDDDDWGCNTFLKNIGDSLWGMPADYLLQQSAAAAQIPVASAHAQRAENGMPNDPEAPTLGERSNRC